MSDLDFPKGNKKKVSFCIPTCSLRLRNWVDIFTTESNKHMVLDKAFILENVMIVLSAKKRSNNEKALPFLS